jgi:3D (Asp-Asp-Asp) domain-containing protein
VLSKSIWLKVLATVLAIVGFVLWYEARMPDSRHVGRKPDQEHATVSKHAAMPARPPFTATAYCKGVVTASGVAPRSGIAAADPALLPVGSVVQINGPLEQYNGIYAIMDTGPRVQGRRVDIYIWSCDEALRFGRRLVDVLVLRLGWSPSGTAPGLVDALLRPPFQRSYVLPSLPKARPPDAQQAPQTPRPSDGVR